MCDGILHHRNKDSNPQPLSEFEVQLQADFTLPDPEPLLACESKAEAKSYSLEQGMVDTGQQRLSWSAPRTPTRQSV